ncbi:MAG: NAD-dependent epimerase/dehydratase family protein [Opitutaceae bacterium]|jgi:UDP-glucose 4-epimerase|nr:NAD-dependent epimerase/dehydratase family protein [Opitutaceae bacterium]
MKKILLTGACGFIGRHLLARLLQCSDYHVRCLDRFKATWLSPASRVQFIEADFCAPHVMEEAIAGCDTIVHLISTTLPQTSNDDPAYDTQTNLIGTISMLDLAVKHKVRRFLYASSGGTIYGNPQSDIISENHPTNPRCSYGIVKLAVEKYLRLYHEIHGLSTLVLRLANPFGEHQRTDNKFGVISTFCHKAVLDECIEIWGDGTVIRDFIYISDLIDALIAALTSPLTGTEINIGSGKGYSINEVIATIEKVLRRKIRTELLPARNFDVPKVVLDISQAERLLRWHPRIPLEEGIRNTLSYHQELTTRG